MNRGTKSLAEKVVIVTGAGRGIGRAIALAYAAAGASVCCAARTATEINETARQIEAARGHAIAVQTDVTNFAEVARMVDQTVAAFGGVDILVINAGVNADRNSVEESDVDAWRLTLDVNLSGAYFCAKAAIPALKARGGGKIITIGSGMGHKGRAQSAAYSCSKAGLWMLTRILAQELWADNISVNELIPGPVVTSPAMTGTNDKNSVFNEGSEWIKSPDKVVPMALFLATQPAIGPSAQSFSLMRRDN